MCMYDHRHHHICTQGGGGITVIPHIRWPCLLTVTPQAEVDIATQSNEMVIWSFWPLNLAFLPPSSASGKVLAVTLSYFMAISTSPRILKTHKTAFSEIFLPRAQVDSLAVLAPVLNYGQLYLFLIWAFAEDASPSGSFFSKCRYWEIAPAPHPPKVCRASHPLNMFLSNLNVVRRPVYSCQIVYPSRLGTANYC